MEILASPMVGSSMTAATQLAASLIPKIIEMKQGMSRGAGSGRRGVKRKLDVAPLRYDRDKAFFQGSGKLNDALEIPKDRKKAGPYSKYGSCGQDEVYGKLSKAEICSLAFCSVKTFGASDQTADIANAGSVSGTLSYHVAAALLRYILQREFKYDVLRHDQLVSPYRLDTPHTVNNHANADCLPHILFYYKSEGQNTISAGNNQAPKVTMGYELVMSQKIADQRTSTLYTFNQLAMLIQQNVITHGNFGGVGDQSQLTHRIYAYQIVWPDSASTDTGTPYVNQGFGPLVNIEDMYMKAYSTGELTLQNITVADSDAEGNQLLMNRVDANPLQGTILKFNTPFPKVKIPTDDLWNYTTVTTGTGNFGEDPLKVAEVDNATTLLAWQLCFDRNGDGLITPKDELTDSWIQLPDSTMFYGCTGEGKFYMAPGEIRKCVLKYEFEGKLKNFITSQQLNNGSEGDWIAANNSRGCGTSVLISMEKVMSTGTNTSVTVNYQHCYYAGAVMTGVRKPRMQAYNHHRGHKTAMNQGTNPSLDKTTVFV